MTLEPQPSGAPESWAKDAAALILDPKRDWTMKRPFAALIRDVMLDAGASVTADLRNRVLLAALAHGQVRTPVAQARAERGLREGVRGYLWLPEEPDGDLALDGEPDNPDDVVVVADGLSSVDRREVMQRQRWAALRMGRVLGKEYKRSTLRKYGLANRPKYADRLTADLAAFFADEAAVEQFVTDVVPLELQQARFRAGSFVSEPLRRRLRVAAETLGRVPPYYPAHLTILDLTEGRQLAPYSPEGHGNAEGAYYVTGIGYFDDYAYSNRRVREAVWPVLERERRLVILGDPGSGKSTIAQAAVLRALASSERAVAVLVSAPVLVRELLRGGQDWLEVLARAGLSTPMSPAAEGEVMELAGLLRGSASSLIVLDGIDEVFDPHARRMLDEVIDGLTGLRVRALMTARMVGYRRRPGWTTMRTLPLDEDFDSMLERWYAGRDQEALERGRATIEANDDLKELAKSPVLAGLIAARAADPRASEISDLKRLYDWAVTTLCEREWKNPHHPPRADREVMTLLEAYEEAAWGLSGGADVEGPVVWDAVTSYRELHELGIDVEALRAGEVLIEYGATGTEARIDAPWLWLHRSFADYFVSIRLARMWRAGDPRLENLIQRALQTPDVWLGALRLFASQLGDAELSEVRSRVDSFISEGDPGGIVGWSAAEAFAEYNPDDLFGENSDDSDYPEVTLSDALLHPVNIPSDLEFIRSDEDRLAAVRAYLAYAPAETIGYELRTIRDEAATAYAVALAERLADRPEGGLRIVSVWDPEVPADDPGLEEFWRGYLEQSFPDCLPYGLALGNYLLDQEEQDDETRLAIWAHSLLNSGVLRPAPKRLRAGKKLLREALNGEWGEWAAFTVAHLEPHLAARHLDELSTQARLGFLFTAFGEPWLDVESPARSRPLTMTVAEATAQVRGFSRSDLEKVDVVAQLVEAIRVLSGTEDPAAFEALVLLRDWLGPAIGWEWGARYALSARDLGAFVRAAVGAVVAGIEDQNELAQTALRLRAAGHVTNWWAIPEPWHVRPGDSELAAETLAWLAEQEPLRLDDFGDLLFGLDYDDAVAMVNRIGSFLPSAPDLERAVARSLSEAGELPLWRDRLIALASRAEAGEKDVPATELLP